jgi:hypothetical protein
MRFVISMAILALILLPIPAAAAQQEGMARSQQPVTECSSEHMMMMADMMGELQHDMMMMTGMMEDMKAGMMSGMGGAMPMGGMDSMMPMDQMHGAMPMGQMMGDHMQMMGAMMGQMQHEMEMMAMMYEMMGCPMPPGGM